ncbi:CHASE3 domain-containing protein, partial [Roseisolibacter sp. H3M3-2]|uniref:CHASE3 domain-containing protein n=1 Tax=Roseisolibacter sp. H3M3-2 TaxID=3031323 RepID=UPI0023DB5827
LPKTAWPPTSLRRVLSSRARRLALVAGPALALAGLALTLDRAVRRERSAGARVANTQEVRAAVAQLFAELADAETGQRGYLLTGRAEFLDPHRAGRRAVPATTARLRALTRDNPGQQARLDTLARVAAARLALLDSGIALHDAGRRGDALALVAMGGGNRLMGDARALAERVVADLARLLRARQVAAAGARRLTVTAFVAGSAAVVAVALLANCALGGAAVAEARARASLAQRTEALERAVAVLRAALDARRTGTWEWDRATRRLEWATVHERLLGHPRASADGGEAAFLALVEPADREPLLAALARGRATGAEHAHEFRLRRADGGVAWVLGRGRYLLGDDGAPLRATGTVTDVTAQKAAERERLRLEASLRDQETMAAIGTVAAGVAHEVRNPLFGMSAVLDAMDATFPDRAELAPFQERLRAQVTRVGDLMADLLEYGRPARAEARPAPLAPVLAEAVANCRPTTDRLAVAVETTLGEAPLPPVAMDRRRLVRVFQNLLENAAQHTAAGGVVRLTAEAERGGAWVACRVSDRGPGIPPDHLPRLFEPFFTKRRGGTGLGLSIVQRIVREHGGEIAAANAAGGGATFTVRLPAAAEG